MAAEPIDVTQNQAEPTPIVDADADDHGEGKTWASPRGAAAFGFFMVVAYAIYLSLLWLDVIGRGS